MIKILLSIHSNLMKANKKSKEQIQNVTQLLADFGQQQLQKRINAASNLRIISQTLGSQRVKKQFIPFLVEEILDDDTQVLLALIDNLECIGQCLGGGIAYTFLFPILHELLQNQEEKIRKNSVLKYFELINLADVQKCEKAIMDSLKKVFSFQYQSSKQGFCCVVSKKLGYFAAPNQLELLNLYQELVQSNSPTQRKFAALYSCNLVSHLNSNESAILKILQLLFKDKQQSNKIYLISSVIELSKYKSSSALQPYFNLISYQFTWRVRYQLISKIKFLAEAMGKQNFKSFLTYFIKYINDIEPQIRSIANMNLECVINYLEVDQIINRILPALKNIPQDTHAYVRNSFASSLLHFCTILGKKLTSQHILPKFLQLLKDQDEHVRLTIFKKVNLICEVLGIQTLSQSVIPILNQLLGHANWRIRCQGIQIFYYFLENQGQNFMNQKNIQLVLDLLKDRAFAVRKEGINLLLKIIDKLGQQWFQKTLAPKLLPMFKASTYIQRQTILLALQSLLPKLTLQYQAKIILPQFQLLISDGVQNVRMSLCKALGVMFSSLPKEKESVRKILKGLKQDKDRDVRDIASKVFENLQS